jgi:uncharacterized protein (TIGR04255 family)
MGEKLAKAPVFLTAAQIRHNPILSFDEYAARLQEKFRKIGFSDYKLKVQSGFEIEGSDPTRLKVRQKDTHQHSYINREGSAGFVTDGSRLYFQVTEYDVFETFRDQFLKGIEILNDAVTLDYVDVVSMRLLDAIVPHSEDELDRYVVQELIGIAAKIQTGSWKIDHAATESVIISDTHRIVVRTLSRRGKLTVPPDLNITGMKLMPRFESINEVHAILDTDCLFESRESFDISNISSRLRLLKDDLRMTFRAAVTPYALETWG